MNNSGKMLLGVLSAVVFSLTGHAAGNEEEKTLAVLRSELYTQSIKPLAIAGSADSDRQREEMAQLGRKCNELSLVLYSQSQDFTFDMTYALGEVTRQYEAFTRSHTPYDEIVSNIDYEIDKYNRLLNSISAVRPVDEQGMEDRDSCLVYTRRLIESYTLEREKVLSEAEDFDQMSERLKESYDYAKDGYEVIHRRIFHEGEDSYLKVLAHLGGYVKRVWNDINYKYFKASSVIFVKHDFWSLFFKFVFVFLWLCASIYYSIRFRVKSGMKKSLKIYVPLLVLGVVVVFFRLIFVPNSLLNLVYTPLLIGFAAWEYRVCKSLRGEVARNEMMYGWVSFAVMLICSGIALTGFVLMSLQVMVWWLFQVAAISTLDAISEALERYESKILSEKIKNSEAFSTGHYSSAEKGDFIHVTWLYDLVVKALLPIAVILSVVFSIWWAADLFDLTEVVRAFFRRSFFSVSDENAGGTITLSFAKIVIAVILFFIFRYLSYAGKAFYRSIKLTRIKDKSGKQFVHANEVNLTLANNVISICLWGLYIIVSINMMNIPLGTVSVVAAGLAAGIGLAMKDILNNFIYGIQLMTGRLRVGDYIECDGVRGKVENITYQSTSILTGEGAVMAVTNTTLFNQNFKNLTKNSYYELLKVPVGVAYGTDVEKVRKILSEEVMKLQSVNDYGRTVIREDYGVQVVIEGFGDSSVDLTVKLFVLVSERFSFAAQAREVIYNALNVNGVEIPFPQRDIHIIQ